MRSEEELKAKYKEMYKTLSKLIEERVKLEEIEGSNYTHYIDLNRKIDGQHKLNILMKWILEME